MSRILIMLALIVVAFAPMTANAKKARFSVDTMCAALQPCQPPAKYASGPFLKPPQVVHVTLRKVQRICGRGLIAYLGEDAFAGGPGTIQAITASGGNFGPNIMGCAQLTSANCVVHVPSEFKSDVPELYDLVLAHELAHCRGWVHARY